LVNLILLGFCASVVIFWGGYAFGFLNGPSALLISCWSLAGFALLMVGLWNVNLLFALSSPSGAVVSAAVGCGVNLAMGYVLSRLGGYEFAVYGFFAGSAMFAACSMGFTVGAFRTLDHRYCALAR
jgi:hypothetical protein